MRALFITVAVLITYGSIYPFEFRMENDFGEALRTLLSTYDGQTRRGDILGNVALFLPFGFFGIPALLRSRSFLSRALVVFLLGFILSLGLQVAQIFVPGRQPALVDVYWNLLGMGIGLVGGRLIPLTTTTRGLSIDRSSAFPLLLIGSWVAYRLIPFVPTIDFQEIKDSLKPLLLNPEFSFVRTLHNTTGWLVVATLWRRSVPRSLPDGYLLLLVPVVYALEVGIISNAITVSNVAGASVALCVWFGLLRRMDGRYAIMALLVGLSLVVRGLEPFEIGLGREKFLWIPFTGFLGGSMQHNTAVMFEKVFFYGAFIWLLVSIRVSWLAAVGLGVVLTAGIEWAQIYFGPHSPEITDPLLMAGMAFVMRTMDEKQFNERFRRSDSRSAERSPGPVPPEADR